MSEQFVSTDIGGTKHYFKDEEMSILHREDGPAIEHLDGSKEWYINNRLHREDGPAVESPDGSKSWFVHGKRHRIDGPSVEFSNGDRYWYVNDELHREDGPAVEHVGGSPFEVPSTNTWWIHGKQLTEEQINKQLLEIHKSKRKGVRTIR